MRKIFTLCLIAAATLSMSSCDKIKQLISSEESPVTIEADGDERDVEEECEDIEGDFDEAIEAEIAHECDMIDEVSRRAEASTRDEVTTGKCSTDDAMQYNWLSERKVTASDLAGLSKGELRILRNAIYARHGYKFKNAQLREYFSSFSWYEPLYDDVNSSLSKTEQYNVDFIQSYE